MSKQVRIENETIWFLTKLGEEMPLRVVRMSRCEKGDGYPVGESSCN